jgi:mono/diheme cytochrome c family protein
VNRGVILLASLAALLLGAGALVWRLNFHDGVDVTPAVPPVISQALVERGAYLARAGNCMSCHTQRGGTPYAGGRGIETPFGTVYSSNLTPDRDTGIGLWNAAEFWRALHHGRSRDGRLLSPAFPYTSTTQISRADADALYAWLMSLPPVKEANRPNALRWPFGTQAALAFWRALYFRPGEAATNPAQSAEWNRGAYLVRAFGHCAECHTARNALGAAAGNADLGGGLIPMQNWYAPSLKSGAEAGVADWDLAQIVSLFKTGQSPRGQVTGPMADVVQHSTQYLNDGDLTAMAVYLKSLPQTSAASDAVKPPAVAVSPAKRERGTKLYEEHCAKCHGKQGEGIPGAYPALAGNRAVTMPQTTNLVQTVLHGGFAPATAGNPRPYGMPPYVLVLNDADIAAVSTHLRTAWGNAAPEVTELEVNRVRDAQGR